MGPHTPRSFEPESFRNRRMGGPLSFFEPGENGIAAADDVDPASRSELLPSLIAAANAQREPTTPKCASDTVLASSAGFQRCRPRQRARLETETVRHFEQRRRRSRGMAAAIRPTIRPGAR